MPLRMGIFAVPDASDPSRTVEQVLAADQTGLEVAGIQDHPYQRRFFDTWTLLSWLAARTERVALVPDVVNLPLRPPAVLAKRRPRWTSSAAGGSSSGSARARSGTRSPPWAGRVARRRNPSTRSRRPLPFSGPRGTWGARSTCAARITTSTASIPGRRPPIPSGCGSAPTGRGCSAAPAALTDHLLAVAGLGFTTLLVGVPAEHDDPVGFVRRLGEEVAPRVRERAG